jgi:hypothetical protein
LKVNPKEFLKVPPEVIHPGKGDRGAVARSVLSRSVSAGSQGARYLIGPASEANTGDDAKNKERIKILHERWKSKDME